MFGRLKKCPKCGGHMKKTKKLQEEFVRSGITISVPNVTAFVCKDCGSHYFNWKTVKYIETYVNSLDDNNEEE